MKRHIQKASLILCVLMLMSIAMPASFLPQMQVAAAQAQTISLNRTKVNLYKGKTYKLKVRGTKQAIKWSSSDKRIVSVNKNGKIAAKRVGTAVIIAKVGGQKLKCKVSVKSPLTASVNELTLWEKQTKQVEITYAFNGSVSWEVDDDDIVTCEWTKKWSNNTTKLKIKGLKAGKTVVTISNDESDDVVQIPVTVKFKGVAIKANKTAVTLEPRQEETIKITVNEPNDSYELNCAVQNSEIVSAKVYEGVGAKDYELELTAKKQGSTIVTLVNPDTGSKVNISVNVKLNGPAITADTTYVSLKSGQDQDVKITQKEDGTLSCVSSDTSVAKVKLETRYNYCTLTITGVKAGTATITVKNDATGSTAAVQVTVKDGITIQMPYTPITLNEYNYSGDTIQQTYTITDVDYEVKYDKYDDDYTVYLYFGGYKLYDYRGSGQSSSAKVGWKLYDADGSVVESGTCYSPNIQMGESWKAANAKDYIWHLNAGEYRLVLLSVD